MATPISNIAPGLSNSVFAPKLGGQTGNMQTSSPAVSSGGSYNPWAGLGSTYNSSFTAPNTSNVTGFSPTGQAQTTSISTPPPQSQVTASTGTVQNPSSNTPAQNSMMTPGGGFATPGSTVNGVGTNLFPGVASSLANTQPSAGTTNAVSYLQGQATGSNPAQQNINTLTGIGQNQTPAVQQSYNTLANFNQANPLTQSAQAALPMAALISSGRGQILGNQLAGEQQGLANTYNAAVTGEGQQISAANAAGGQQLTGQQQQIGAANNAGGLANTAQSNQIGAQTSALNAIQPQLGAYGQTYYNPLVAGTNQGGVGGVTGPAAAGVVAGQQQAGQTYTQNNAILGKVSAQLPALSQLIQSSGYNANPATYINQLQQWGAGTLSNSSIPEVQGSLNDIVASLSQVLGVPSSGASDFRTQFAAQIVNGLQSGQSIQDALQFAVTQATAGNQGYLQGATGQTGQNGSPQGGSSLYNF